MADTDKENLDKNGYLKLENVFDEVEAIKLYEAAMELDRREREEGKGFLYLEDRAQRVWNLVNKNRVFEEAIQHPRILEWQEYLLGKDCILSSLTVNRIGPGAPPGMHIDYPLSSLPEPLPAFALCANSVFLLTDFTEENGATRVVPGSHLRGRKPGPDEKFEDSIPLLGKKGDVVIIHGTIWHGNGTNHTNDSRVALLGFFCRSFMKPQQDHIKIVSQDVVQRASPILKRLLGYDSQPNLRY